MENTSCLECHRAIPPRTPHGVCPACLMELALVADSASRMADSSIWGATGTITGGNRSLTADFGDGDSTPDDSSSETSPPLIPGYIVHEKIGSGGMGTVFRALQIHADRTVALKVIRANAPDQIDSRKRFRTEARALARVQHPNIVQIYDVGETESGPFFSMEYVPGENLSKWLKRSLPTPAQAARLVEFLARAVAAAHQADILHRDLKPANVLMCLESDQPDLPDSERYRLATPKLTDFGLAKRLENDAGHTHPGSILGTPDYMAPEQADGRSKEVGPGCDIYALGVTLYQMLTGAPPFHGETPAETLAHILTSDPEPPSTRQRAIPKELEAICMKCLEKRPSDRYATANALAEDLARWQRGDSTIARPAGFLKKVRRIVRRRPFLAFGPVALLLATAIVVFWLPRLDPDHQRLEIQRELDRGEHVTLIGETGLPRWYKWQSGASTFGDSPIRDGTCSFQTHTESYLELVTDPRRDEYRFRVEIRQNRNPKLHGTAGIYFGYRPTVDANGTRITRLMAVGYSDWYPKEPFDLIDIKTHAVSWDDRVLTQKPGGIVRRFGCNITRLPFIANHERQIPNPWRQIVVDVRRDTMTVSWRDDQGNLSPLSIQNPAADNPKIDFINGLLDQYTQMLKRDPDFPGKNASFPGWNPRLPLGLFAEQCGVSFRNAILEPIP